MIQFNLLPNVKQEFIRAERTKRLMLAVSFISSAAALGVLILSLSTVYLVQRGVIASLQNDIATNSSTLKNTANISDILTVQSQLNSLSTLHNQKPVASRLFGYLALLTPTKATISDLRVDFTLNTMTFNGNAPGLDVVNTFVDELKYTSYTTADNTTTSTPAFSNVSLASFSRNSKSATYSITLTFDKTIFDTTKQVTLVVGGQNTPTNPSVIFKKDS